MAEENIILLHLGDFWFSEIKLDGEVETGIEAKHPASP
jgi:hypothetical protein